MHFRYQLSDLAETWNVSTSHITTGLSITLTSSRLTTQTPKFKSAQIICFVILTLLKQFLAFKTSKSAPKCLNFSLEVSKSDILLHMKAREHHFWRELHRYRARKSPNSDIWIQPKLCNGKA